MHTSLSKKLLAGLLSLVMVLSLVAPGTSAQAATKYSLTDKKSVKSGYTFKYELKGVSKGCYVKVTRNVSGEKVVYNKKELTKTTKVNGTGKTLNLYVTYGEKDENYTGKFTVRVYGKKTNKLYKTLVETVTVKVPEKEEPQPEEPVAELPAIASAKAVKVDTIEVTFASAVTAEDVALTVAKGTNAVTTGAATWNADKTVATLVTDAKLTEGTYTVKAASATLDKSVEGTFAVEAQRVEEIVIKDSVALTLPGTIGGVSNTASAIARVYYDVLDQYGQSIRSTTSLTWSTSCGDPKTVSAAKGYIEVKRSDDKAFTYGEQLFVTAVHEKTGKSLNKTLTIGMGQELDRVEMVGFVKTNTSTLVESLPADYKDNEYSLAYKTVDQNDNALDAKTTNVKDGNVTFLSDNAMLIGTKFEDGNIAIIDGEEYNTVKIARGIKVNDGGDVKITAISNKTGAKVEKVFTVGEDVKLTTFTLGQPKALVADGETVELEFTALDQNGNEIKNFVNLAKNYQFNALSFTVNVGQVLLKENNDGSASLYYKAPDVTFGTTEMDGVDVPVVITAIVINGNGSNTQFGVVDKARPEGITGVRAGHLSEVNLEGTALAFAPDKFTYVDQYGRSMTTDAAVAFLDATHPDGGKTYHYGIKLDYVGDGFTNKIADYAHDEDAYGYTAGASKIADYDAANTVAKADYYVTSATAKTVYTSTKVYGKAKTNDLVKFSIVRSAEATLTADPAKIEGVSPEKSISFTTVDIDMLKSFEVDKQHAVALVTDYTDAESADAVEDKKKDNSSSAEFESSRCASEVYADAYGYYNGVAVKITGGYASITGTKFFNSGATSGAAIGTAPQLDVVPTWNDLYDFTTAKNLRRPVQYEKVVYTINKLYNNLSDASVANADANGNGIYDANDVFLGGAFVGTEAATVVATANSKLGYSDGARTATSLVAVAECIVNPTDTKIDSNFWTMNANGIKVGSTWYASALDQYGDGSTGLTYEVKNYVENESGEVENNHRVSGQGTSAVTVDGAERGDTFDLVITLTNSAKKEVEVKTMKVTVGADTKAKVTEEKNFYYFYNSGFGGLHHILNQQRDGIYQ